MRKTVLLLASMSLAVVSVGMAAVAGVRKAVRPLVSVPLAVFMALARSKKIALVGLLCLLVGMSASSTSSREAEAASRPNVLFILTDDQNVNSFGRMDQVRRRLIREGVRFPHALVTTPKCCPSRATFLRGQYAHNHGVQDNQAPEGGWEKFR